MDDLRKDMQMYHIIILGVTRRYDCSTNTNGRINSKKRGRVANKITDGF